MNLITSREQATECIRERESEREAAGSKAQMNASEEERRGERMSIECGER
jgi:hypothetical protein